MVSCTPWEDALRKAGGIGKLLPFTDGKIVDETGNELPPNSIGELLLKSAKNAKGYWKNPEATKETIVDGWVHTGDIGKVDEEGFFYILDRKKDMINRGGEKIYSLEVENTISSLGKVLEVAVVAVPDRVMGEAVKAAVVLKQGEDATEEDIKAFCAEHLADFKVPKYVAFMESLPRNPAGKVIKDRLRDAPAG
jgi:acyl-CoA synthetase (AMP-forming)/AMP-acid ligase II